MTYDAIIIGSGAGGSAAAYQLVQFGCRVLLLERGHPLPRDGSTLDVDKVFRHRLFMSDETWLDKDGRLTVPQERYNLGGKTKWYGAALLRYGRHEFDADESHQCRAWPIGYDELEPYYAQAEALLGVRCFAAEAGLQGIIAGLRRQDAGWRREPLPLGLAPDILSYPHEARRFDGFASVCGLKSDAEVCLLDRVRRRPNFTIATGKHVRNLLPGAGVGRVAGVECEDGSRYQADVVILAAGALHSPRLLQRHLASTGQTRRLRGYGQVGRNYKFHLLSALIAFSVSPSSDLLRKTTLLLHDALPHSSVQPLGFFDGELLGAELPSAVPRAVANFAGARAYGFFLQTEDGSHADNRIVDGDSLRRPVIDYDPARLPAALAEHRLLRRTLQRQLLRLGHAVVLKSISVAGTAHACGTLVAGSSAVDSVVGADGRVHGFDNLYVADGSVLPRSARVNPALTIYAWGLRVASLIQPIRSRHEQDVPAAAHTIRA